MTEQMMVPLDALIDGLSREQDCYAREVGAIGSECFQTAIDLVTQLAVPTGSECFQTAIDLVTQLPVPAPAWRSTAEALLAAINALPVEDWVQEGPDGEPELVGYVMQAQGEWDAVKKAAAALQELIQPPEQEVSGE